MSAARHIALALTFAAGLCAGAAPSLAQTRTEVETASSAPLLNLTSEPTEAIKAAKAAQQPQGHQNSPSAPVATPSAARDGVVEAVTVPAVPDRTPRVVASTEATSLSSPNFSAKDVSDLTLAVSAGSNSAVGAQSVDNTHSGGFLAVNPQGGPTRTDVGFTNVFSTR